jgi:hypothetical protein
MRVCFLRILCASCAVLLAEAALSDVIKLRHKPPFRNVQIVALRDDVVVFRGVSRERLRKSLDDIQWIELDDLPELTDAERAAVMGDTERAIAAYAAASEKTAVDWQRELVQARLVRCADAAGRFDVAVQAFLGLLRSNPGLAGHVAPSRCGVPGASDNATAVASLERFIAATDAGAARSQARAVLLQLLFVEGVTDIPTDVVGPAPPVPAPPPLRPRTAPPARVAEPEPKRPRIGLLPPSDEPATKPTDQPVAVPEPKRPRIGLLPPPDEPETKPTDQPVAEPEPKPPRIGLLPPPGEPTTKPTDEPVGLLPPEPASETSPEPPPPTEPTPAPARITPIEDRTPVHIPYDGILRHAVERALADGEAERAAALLDRAWPYLEESERARWRLLHGQVRIATGHAASAASDLIALAESEPPPALAAEALYYVGLAHEQMGRPDVARRTYRTLSADPSAPAEFRSRATAALARLDDPDNAQSQGE